MGGLGLGIESSVAGGAAPAGVVFGLLVGFLAGSGFCSPVRLVSRGCDVNVRKLRRASVQAMESSRLSVTYLLGSSRSAWSCSLHPSPPPSGVRRRWGLFGGGAVRFLA